ncbi:MAG: hypothetical protein ACK55Z_23450, partial [bacterium]
ALAEDLSRSTKCGLHVLQAAASAANTSSNTKECFFGITYVATSAENRSGQLGELPRDLLLRNRQPLTGCIDEIKSLLVRNRILGDQFQCRSLPFNRGGIAGQPCNLLPHHSGLGANRTTSSHPSKTERCASQSANSAKRTAKHTSSSNRAGTPSKPH